MVSAAATRESASIWFARFCASANRRAFSIAVAAWFANAIARFASGAPKRAASACSRLSIPMTLSLAMSGTPSQHRTAAKRSRRRGSCSQTLRKVTASSDGPWMSSMMIGAFRSITRRFTGTSESGNAWRTPPTGRPPCCIARMRSTSSCTSKTVATALSMVSWSCSRMTVSSGWRSSVESGYGTLRGAWSAPACGHRLRRKAARCRARWTPGPRAPGRAAGRGA